MVEVRIAIAVFGWIFAFCSLMESEWKSRLVYMVAAGACVLLWAYLPAMVR